MKKIRFFWLCCLLFFAGSMTLYAQKDAENDALLQLLRQEMQQQFDSLQKADHPPYYMAYRVNETTEHLMTANFGQIYANNSSKTAFLTIEIRVGSPETDNYHYFNNRNTYLKQIPLPIEENESLVRKIIQTETHNALQEAILQNVENQLKVTTLDPNDNQEKLIFLGYDRDGYYDLPLMDSHWNAEDWEIRLRHCTFEDMLQLTSKSAKLRYQTVRKYLVNSEKSYFVENQSSAMLTLRVEGLTQDNIPEHIERQYFAFYPDQLPDKDALNDEMNDMEMALSLVYFAETSKPFHCPVLFSPNAASVLIHNLLGHELENQEKSIFWNKIGQQVLPETFSVYSDPTVSKADGHYYGGHYVFDDEGVKSERVMHISHGELQKMLASRTQQPNAYHSNSHARGNHQLPTVRQSNLFVESSKVLNDSQLFELLEEEASQQKLDYVLYVQEVELRCDTNDLVTIYPTFCYKIYPKKQKDEVVRDVILTGSKQQWINNLIAAGASKGNVTLTCHSHQDDLLTNCASPALLFRSVEVQEQKKTPQPTIPRMLTGKGSNSPMNTEELFQMSAQYEWELDLEHLKFENENAPYYEDFLMTDARVFTVEASEGSLLYANEKPVRQFVPKVLLGNNVFNNENLYEETAGLASLYSLQFGNNYSFAQDFWRAAENEYLKALNQMKIKQAVVGQNVTNLLPDRSSIKATQTYQAKTIDYPSLNNLEHLARETSSELAKNDFLSRSGAHIYILSGNAYYWSSEKTSYSKPISIIAVQIYGAVKTLNNSEYMDGKTIFLPCTDSLFSSQSIHNEIDKLVSHLRTVKQKSQPIAEFYVGPILVEGEAVGQMLASALLENAPNLLAYRTPILTSEEESRKKDNAFENQLDQIVTSKKISVTANKSGDSFDQSPFCRQDKIDAEGAEVSEMEIVKNGELITLMGNRTVTKSTPYSNGFQQLAIHNEGCIATRGASRLDVECKASVPHQKLKQMLISEAKKQGCRYAYIIRQIDNGSLQSVLGNDTHRIEILQLYRVDIQNGKEVPVIGGMIVDGNFGMLQDLVATSNTRTAYPIMTRVNGTTTSRDFPFAGVPTCIVAPDGMLLRRGVVGR
jgi:predicted Zn-dependent protease